MTSRDTQVLQGRGAAEGIAIGSTVLLTSRQQEVYRFAIPPDRVDAEFDRLRQAVKATREELSRLQDKVVEQVGADLAAIFEAQGLMVQDRLLLDRVEVRIREEGVNAEWALHEAARELDDQFAQLESEHLRERSEDLRDVVRYLMKALQGISHHELSEIEGDVIVIADELTPSETLRLGRQGIAGLALEHGGKTSHTAIVARALGVPMVTGLGTMSHLVTDQDLAIVDGDAGTLILHPDGDTLEAYRGARREERRSRLDLEASTVLGAATLDGVEISVLANIEFPEELEDVLRSGADGIGLYRSEFLYLEKSPELPTEEEHFALFRKLLEALAPRPVIIRTLDLGGRKLAREVLHTEEANPVLGLRGIRLTLTRPQIFRTQLRALFRASAYGNLGIMIPLVSTVEEVLLFKALCDEIVRELVREGRPPGASVQLGAMVEVPATALIADRLAELLDFLSIGTNDLIQYTLAVDRNNEHVAGLYQPFHPAVIELITRVTREAGERGTGVSLCGEMAANPLSIPLLLGAGLRSLSMAPRSVPVIKRVIRSLRCSDSEEILQECTKIRTAYEIEEYLRKRTAGLALEGAFA